MSIRRNLEIIDVRDRDQELTRHIEDATESLGKLIARFTLALVFYHTLSGLLNCDNLDAGYWTLTSWMFMMGFSPQILNHRYFFRLTGYSSRYESHRRVAVLLLITTLYGLLCLWLILRTPQEADLARMARHAIKSVALIIVK